MHLDVLTGVETEFRHAVMAAMLVEDDTRRSFRYFQSYGEEEAGATLVNRAQAGCALSWWLCAQRYAQQLLRSYHLLAMDLLLTWGAALFVGLIHGQTARTDINEGYNNEGGGEFYRQGPAYFLLFILTIGLVAAITALRLFGEDRAVFWRERSAGLRVGAHVLSLPGVPCFPTIAFAAHSDDDKTTMLVRKRPKSPRNDEQYHSIFPIGGNARPAPIR